MVSPSRTPASTRTALSARSISPSKSGAGRQTVDLQRSGSGQEVVVGVLGADAGLDGVAVDAQLILLQRQRLAGCHTQLPLNQVLPGDGLSNWMLHLQARVHLHEVKLHLLGGLVTTGLLHDEFHRARTHVTHGPCGRYLCLAHLAAQVLEVAAHKSAQPFYMLGVDHAGLLVEVVALVVRLVEPLVTR